MSCNKAINASKYIQTPNTASESQSSSDSTLQTMAEQ